VSTWEEYRLYIDVFSVDSIPMARLAEYMAQLADLLGETEKVHFARLQEGSVNVVAKVEPEAAPKVSRRTEGVRVGSGAADALKAAAVIDNMLADDNAVGSCAVWPFLGTGLTRWRANSARRQR
jgi:hypothetical protein